jgi:hypothetical protein
MQSSSCITFSIRDRLGYGSTRFESRYLLNSLIFFVAFVSYSKQMSAENILKQIKIASTFGYTPPHFNLFLSF